MARQNVEPVRQRLWAHERSSRTLDQRLYLRFPRLGALGARLFAQLPPRSRLRQAALLRATRLSLEAYNRRDLKAVVVGWDPEFEYIPDRQWVDAGLVEPSYHGLAGYRRFIATADEVWGEENELHPIEVIDFGDRLLVRADVTMRAQVSGVPLTQPWGALCTLRNGMVIRLEEHFDHARALAAVGLSG
ncbi:MAG TPA: nuclear transport factor 2 family protein [Thermoleophilaceae bacterium]